MQDVQNALREIKDLYQKVLGHPAPDLRPDAYASIPPGVDPLELAVQEVEQLKQYTEAMASAPRPAAWVPRADTYLTEDAFLIQLEIPGVRREEVKVLVAGGECVVRGERTPPKNSDLRPLGFERAWGPFERRIVLPRGCYPDRVSAKCTDGVLEVRIGKERDENPVETKVEA